MYHSAENGGVLKLPGTLPYPCDMELVEKPPSNITLLPQVVAHRNCPNACFPFAVSRLAAIRGSAPNEKSCPFRFQLRCIHPANLFRGEICQVSRSTASRMN